MPSERWLAGRLVERLGGVPELDLAVALDSAHEGVGHRDRHVEVGERAVALGVDEVLDVRMVAAHLPICAPRRRRPIRASRSSCRTRACTRSARWRANRAVHQRPLRADRRKVVADAAAAPHGFRSLVQRVIDRRHAVARAADRVADRLHEAVDQGGRDAGARGRVDAAAGNEAVDHRVVEALFPDLADLSALDLRQPARDAAAHFVDRLLVALGVLLEQYVDRDRLLVEQHLRLVQFHRCLGPKRPKL